MMKFFRKHTKELLAVFMALLLVVWLGGTALTEALQPDGLDLGERLGTLDGRAFTRGDLIATERRGQTLEALNLPWQQPWWSTMRSLELGFAPQLQELSENPLTTTEFHLLLREADTNHVVVSDESLMQFKDQIGLTDNVLFTIRDRNRLSVDEMHDAIRALLRVSHCAAQAARGLQPSEAEIQQLVHQIGEKAKVQSLTFNAGSLLNQSYNPPEQEIREQYEKYREEPPTPPGSLEFGYMLPEAAQIEYIEIKADAVKETSTISDEEAYAFWKDNKARFTKPTPPPPPAAEGEEPPTPDAPQPYATYTEAKTKVLDELKTQRSKEEAVRIAREAIALASIPWADAPTTQPGDYKIPPESQKNEKVYEDIVARLSAKYPGVLRYQRTAMLTALEFRQNRDLAGVSAQLGQRTFAQLSQAAYFVPELSAKPEDFQGQERLFRSLYQTCPEPFTNFGSGNAYVFRTVDVRKQQAPESLDLVREQIVKDLRMKWAYEEAEILANEFAEKVGTSELKAMYEADIDLKKKIPSPVQEPAPFARKMVNPYTGLQPASVPGIGSDEELMDKIFANADGATTQPTAPLVHGMESRAQYVVIQLQEIQPVNTKEYPDLHRQAADQLRRDRQGSFLAKWFDADNIRSRMAWVPAEPANPKDDAKEAESDNAQKAAL